MKRVLRMVRWLLAPALVWALYWMRANIWFRLYPVVMVFVAWAVFTLSLFRTPLVEVFARKMGSPLDARGRAYCRSVTRVWVAFLSLHLVVTFATVWAPYGVWAWYNGFFAYLLMGALFVGEWLVRRRVMRHG